MTRDMLGVVEPRGRHASPALSDTSELSALSRTPSPPPELLTRFSPSVASTAKGKKRALSESRSREGSMFLGNSSAKKRKASLRSNQKGSERKTSRKKTKASAVTCSNTVTTIRAARGDGGIGVLGILPKELRQIIYAYALDIDTPVSLKKCCGPTWTKRARDACKKHGDNCKKIGKYNAVYTGSFRKQYGKFNIFLVSQAIKEEAQWVLFNQGTLSIQIAPWLVAYLSGTPSKMVHRLKNLPKNEQARAMWMMAARFRHTRIEIPKATLENGDPLKYTARLREAASMLLKARELQPEKPTAAVSYNVIVQLGDLYNRLLPFNVSDNWNKALLWAVLYPPVHPRDVDKVGVECGRNLERLVQVVGRHRGKSAWKITATTVGSNDDDFKEGASWLCALEEKCLEQGIEFETVA